MSLVRLLAEHRRMVVAYAYAITGDLHLAEDAAQEVALVVAERWDQVPRDAGVVPWLKEVTRRRALEALRRFGRRPALDPELLESLAEAFPSGEDEERARRRELVSRCLGKLGGDARAVIAGRYWDGLDCERIAERLGRTVKAVYGILARSRVALADCIENGLADSHRGEAR
jgi:RNA polymerase sigma-70 factor (ECF subfamily)